MRRVSIALGALLVLGCGGASATGGGTTVPPQHRRCTAALRFREPPEPAAPDSAERPPRTEVTLVLICEDRTTATLHVGSEVGACYPIEASGALLRARCWWAGEGSIVEVRRAERTLTVLRAGIDEHTGVGEPQQVGELEIPEGADVGTL